ncbi:MAG: diaminopropionate ammonia-lyase, partial [Pseudomonadales bacterium]
RLSMNNYNYSHTKHLCNTAQDVNTYAECCKILPQSDCESAKKEISQWSGYAATALIELDDIAAAVGVQSLLYKDESTRFGLGSFKALGGSYAVIHLAEDYRATHGSLDGFAVATATDGNHGLSVAWGAQSLGLECHIFVHAHVSQARNDAMSALGAEVHRIDGNYDDSLLECVETAEKKGWQIVSDTSWAGYESVPVHVMAGYSVMAAEIINQLDGQIPSHMFIQAGCGGLAGGMLAYLWQFWKEQLPTIVIVESELSDCVYQSLEAMNIKLVNVTEETVMAGLSCGEVSRIAWPLLRKGVRHVITIPDDGVVPMMNWLAKPEAAKRPAIEGGECSAASLIALMAAASNNELREDIGLNQQSTVLVIGTEGATDLEFYNSAVNDGQQF